MTQNTRNKKVSVLSRRARKATPAAIRVAHQQLDAILGSSDAQAHDVVLVYLDTMLQLVRRWEGSNGR